MLLFLHDSKNRPCEKELPHEWRRVRDHLNTICDKLPNNDINHPEISAASSATRTKSNNSHTRWLQPVVEAAGKLQSFLIFRPINDLCKSSGVTLLDVPPIHLLSSLRINVGSDVNCGQTLTQIVECAPEAPTEILRAHLCRICTAALAASCTETASSTGQSRSEDQYLQDFQTFRILLAAMPESVSLSPLSTDRRRELLGRMAWHILGAIDSFSLNGRGIATGLQVLSEVLSVATLADMRHGLEAGAICDASVGRARRPYHDNRTDLYESHTFDTEKPTMKSSEPPHPFTAASWCTRLAAFVANPLVATVLFRRLLAAYRTEHRSSSPQHEDSSSCDDIPLRQRQEVRQKAYMEAEICKQQSMRVVLQVVEKLWASGTDEVPSTECPALMSGLLDCIRPVDVLEHETPLRNETDRMVSTDKLKISASATVTRTREKEPPVPSVVTEVKDAVDQPENVPTDGEVVTNCDPMISPETYLCECCSLPVNCDIFMPVSSPPNSVLFLVSQLVRQLFTIEAGAVHKQQPLLTPVLTPSTTSVKTVLLTAGENDRLRRKIGAASQRRLIDFQIQHLVDIGEPLRVRPDFQTKSSSSDENCLATWNTTEVCKLLEQITREKETSKMAMRWMAAVSLQQCLLNCANSFPQEFSLMLLEWKTSGHLARVDTAVEMLSLLVGDRSQLLLSK
eukprot:GHVT01087815.1.p1 GENE.GHVT01087815.1~~GHVT01087815.1.p1  ORF type:complete len:682 (+),score=44.18 GHVT01087815.1:705-2750(+)